MDTPKKKSLAKVTPEKALKTGERPTKPKAGKPKNPTPGARRLVWASLLVGVLSLGGYYFWSQQDQMDEAAQGPIVLGQGTSPVVDTPPEPVVPASNIMTPELEALIAAVTPDHVMVVHPAPDPDAAESAAQPLRDLPFTGRDLLAVEQNLALLALDPGPIDGIIDSRTRVALAEFQVFLAQDSDGSLSKALANDLDAIAKELTGGG